MNELTFCIDKFIYTKSGESLDLSFIPSNIRRRLSEIDKHILYSINCCMTKSVENIIFSSQYGSFDRLLSIIKEYRQQKEVSPTNFSASVHNYSVGQYTLMTKNSIPSSAISACEESFINGLILSIAENRPVVYCYADFFNEIKTVCFLISHSSPQKYLIKKTYENNSTNLISVLDLFSQKINSAETNGYLMEEICDEKIL